MKLTVRLSKPLSCTAVETESACISSVMSEDLTIGFRAVSMCAGFDNRVLLPCFSSNQVWMEGMLHSKLAANVRNKPKLSHLLPRKHPMLGSSIALPRLGSKNLVARSLTSCSFSLKCPCQVDYYKR